jgi:hypothetical protein
MSSTDFALGAHRRNRVRPLSQGVPMLLGGDELDRTLLSLSLSCRSSGWRSRYALGQTGRT